MTAIGLVGGAPQAGGPGHHVDWPALGTVALGALAGLVASVGLMAVITAGFALSFDAIGAVGRASGVRGDLAWLLPAAVDGAMAVGTVTAVVVRRLQQSTAYPWAVVLVNAAISVTCNALHAYMGASMNLPAEVAMAVSAVPAVNLALAVHLLVTLVDALANTLMRSAKTPGPGEEPSRHVDLHQHPEAYEPSITAGGPKGAGSEPVSLGQFPGRNLQRAAWQWALKNRRPDGSLPSGIEIAKTHHRSPRWGRYVKRAGLDGRFEQGVAS